MPNWAIHLIVPLLALLMVSRKEDWKYVLLLLPLAVVSDVDTFVTQHRALLHNIFIPVILLFFGWSLREYRSVFIISAVYFGSHVVLDMFGGGVVLFYPFCNLTLSSKDSSIITMFNQTANLESSHAMYGRVTPHLQSIRPSYEGGDLLNQEASNAISAVPLLETLPDRAFSRSDTAHLNFYCFLSCMRKCHSLIAQGIRAVSGIYNTTAAYLYVTFIMRRGTLPLRIEIRSIRYPCAPRRTQ